MNTLILTKRVMSPRNIINNVLEGDANLINKAIEFFKGACRPTVGYKQIAYYLNVEVIVSSERSEKPKSALEISNDIKKAQYKEEIRLMREAALERKNSNAQAVKPVVIKEEVSEVKAKDEGQQGMLDFDSVTIQPIDDIPTQYEPEVGMDYRDYAAEDYNTQLRTQQITEQYREEPDYNDWGGSEVKLSYEDFSEELYKGFHLKTTRRLDEIERVIKAVYKRHKGNLENKEACRQLCIQAREAFLAMMDENPTHWTWIPTQTYTSKWFAHAVRVCTPHA